MVEFTDLLDIHKRIYETFTALLVLAEQKKELLIKSGISELDRLISEEMGYLRQLNLIENQRLESFKKISLNVGIPERIITLNKLQDLMDDDQREYTIELIGKLADVHQKLKEINDANARLIHQSMQYVDLTMQLIYADSDIQSYQPPNSESDTKQATSKFDFRA